MKRDYEKELRERVDYIRKLLESSGAKGIVFGNSGGKDSALVGILCQKATDKVLAVCMPCQSKRNFGEDLDDAVVLAEQFGIENVVVDLSDTKAALTQAVEKVAEISQQASTNIAPRLRMTTLYAIAQSRGYLVAGTGNKSEYYMGYFTKWGDGAYDFNPDGGFVAFGEKRNEVLSERVEAVKAVFDRCHIPYRIDRDMELGLWQKFMSNIGENMTCALLGVPFKALAESEHARAIKRMGMREVQEVAGKLGIRLTDEMAEAAMNRPITAPYNRPSTLQDLDAKKRTEIDMFAGTVVRLGRKLGVATPVNELFYHGIRVLEEKNEGKYSPENT